MWTILAFALFGIIGPAIVKRYETFLYRHEAPWILQQPDAPRTDAAPAARKRVA